MNTPALRSTVLFAACTLLTGCKGSNSNVAPVPTPAPATPMAPASAVLPSTKAAVGPGAGPAGQVVPASQPASANPTAASNPSAPPVQATPANQAASAAPFAAQSAVSTASSSTATEQVPASSPASTASPLVSGPEALKAVPCSVLDVSLKPGKSDGYFDGMSHSGTYLILTNRSHSACSIPGMPRLTFTDANGPVATIADVPGTKFMHPGPVVLPILLQPKQSVYATARWVDGPVFSDNLCYKLTGVGVAMIHDGATVMPLAGQMCGERSKGVHYDLQRYVSGLPPKNN